MRHVLVSSRDQQQPGIDGRGLRGEMSFSMAVWADCDAIRDTVGFGGTEPVMNIDKHTEWPRLSAARSLASTLGTAQHLRSRFRRYPSSATLAEAE
jgi:hypothetical protein